MNLVANEEYAGLLSPLFPLNQNPRPPDDPPLLGAFEDVEVDQEHGKYN
jgi:hypothetical protein